MGLSTVRGPLAWIATDDEVVPDPPGTEGDVVDDAGKSVVVVPVAE